MPLGVAADDVEAAGGHEDLGARDAAGPHAVDRHLDVLHLFAGNLEGVDEARQHHDSGAVLVVVEDGDVQLVLEALLDVEAAGRGDVLKVDAAKARADCLHDADDLVRVLGVEADGIGVDTC